MFNAKKTKIISTIGPVSSSDEMIEKLIEAGTNIFRFNMKHATIEWHEKYIRKVKKIAKKMNKKIGTLIDLQGPEIRLNTQDKRDILVKEGDLINFSNEFNGNSQISINDKNFFKTLSAGDVFLVDDGLLKFKVIEKNNNSLQTQAMDSGIIKNRKSINIPDIHIKLPSLSKDDYQKLDLAAKIKIDFIALSFTRSKKDINKLRQELEKRKISAKIISKIENREAIDNIDEIVEHTDGIMVARGDLGIEVPIEEIAYIQKKIIEKCRLAQKPVVVATHMLQSMVNNKRPTRAEATDVANAVFDGADAVMLSEETAGGKFPVLAVEAMTRILKFNEDRNRSRKNIEPFNLKQLVIKASAGILDSEFNRRIDAVVVFSETGYTARVLSSFRPKVPIIAVTDLIETVSSLTISYGVCPFFMKAPASVHKSSSQVINLLKKKNIIKNGQILLFVHGEHTKTAGPISSIAIMEVK